MSFVPNFATTEPAPKNAVPFAAACARTCRSTPTNASVTPKLIPIARMPMCSTLEYASMRFMSRWRSRYNAPSASEARPNTKSTLRGKAEPVAAAVIWK